MQIRQGTAWVNARTYIQQNGQWTYIDFIKDANELLLIISQTTTDLNLQTAFNNAFGVSTWTSTTRKRVIINPAVIVGTTNTTNYALNIPTGLGGSLSIENYGSIQGAGGAANGGTGGSAIFAGSLVKIYNQGTIYAGGGGGGIGGNGGGGSYNYDCSYTFCGSGSGFWCSDPFDPDPWSTACKNNYNNPNAYCISANGNIFCCQYDPNFGQCISPEVACCNCCVPVPQTCTALSSGGIGGNGGLGQGYNQNVTGGSPGTAGGTNAGAGGTGGAGGTWGASGSSGNPGSNGNYTAGTAGGGGGLAGFYVVNNGNVTWTNLGSVAGRVI